MMPGTDPWRSLFEHWSAAIPRQGILVTSFGEQIPFVNFLVAGAAVLVERQTPDTTGARKAIVAYSAIQAVKLADPGDLARYQVLGFQPPM